MDTYMGAKGKIYRCTLNGTFEHKAGALSIYFDTVHTQEEAIYSGADSFSETSLKRSETHYYKKVEKQRSRKIGV